jgi:hypothetical protein
MADGISVALVDDEADAYAKCIEMLALHKAKPSAISPRQIVQLVNESIVQAIKGGSEALPLEQRIKDAIQRLEMRLATTPQVINVTLPVLGLRLPKNRDVRVAGISFRASQRFLSGRSIRRDKHGEMIRKVVSEISDVAWAHLPVRAVDGDAARTLANYQTQLALDLINLYAGRLGAAVGAAAYLPGVRQLLRAVSVSYVLGNQAKRQDSFYTAGPRWIELKPMNRYRGYRQLRRLILTQDRTLTAAEDRALSALWWIGRGAVSPWKEQGLVDFVIALESLLLGTQRQSSITWRLKLRASYLLARTRKHRQAVFDAVGRSYAARSAIVHSGSFEVTDQQLFTARTYATIALLNAICDRHLMTLRTEKEIDDWWDVQTLTGSRPKGTP